MVSGEKKGVCHQDKCVSYGRLSKMWTFLSENEGNLLEELLTSRPVYYLLPTFFPPTTYLNFIQFLLIPFLREMTEPRLVYTMDQLICFAWRQRPELDVNNNTASPRLSGCLGPEKVPDNREKNPSPRLLGSWYCEELLVKSPDNRITWNFY